MYSTNCITYMSILKPGDITLMSLYPPCAYRRKFEEMFNVIVTNDISEAKWEIAFKIMDERDKYPHPVECDYEKLNILHTDARMAGYHCINWMTTTLDYKPSKCKHCVRTDI